MVNIGLPGAYVSGDMEWNVDMWFLRKEDPCEMIHSPQNTSTRIYIVEDFLDIFSSRAGL